MYQSKQKRKRRDAEHPDALVGWNSSSSTISLEGRARMTTRLQCGPYHQFLHAFLSMLV
jgi:hypothetical protein